MAASHDFIYLASQSPRRRQLLDQLGVRYELLLPDATEDAEALEVVLPGESPQAYVERVTLAKVGAAMKRLVARGLPEAPVLCSDTTVAVGRRIFGKPADAAEAHRMLSLLSGRTHRVMTAVAVSSGPACEMKLNLSRVSMAPLTPGQIQRYIDSGEPFGKAGAYAIQSAAAAWVTRIDGSYSGIMGLPLFETAQLLSQARVRF